MEWIHREPSVNDIRIRTHRGCTADMARIGLCHAVRTIRNARECQTPNETRQRQCPRQRMMLLNIRTMGFQFLKSCISRPDLASHKYRLTY